MAHERRIELEVEVPGTPEQVWRAIATGPGISSWYVPHVVDEREGGAATAWFGPGGELQVDGRVAAWEPPHRVVFASADGGEGLAFEWLVEACDGASCVVRLVTSGFGSGEDWDEQYDGMAEGWQLFLLNLRLHMEHFVGLTATPMLPGARWPGPRSAAWTVLCEALGVPSAPAVGQRVAVQATDAPALAGRVVDVDTWRLALLVDQPAPGTAFIAAEHHGDQAGVAVWSYLYGPDAAVFAARDEPRWQAWLMDRGAH